MRQVERHWIKEGGELYSICDDLTLKAKNLYNAGLYQVRQSIFNRSNSKEESYTSKASFIDQDEIPIYGDIKTKPSFSGERISRGLYKTKEGFLLNADINGSYNILVKGLASLGKALDRSLVLFHTRSLTGLGTQSNLDLVVQYM